MPDKNIQEYQPHRPKPQAGLLSCLLNWALPGRRLYHRRSPTIFAKRATAARAAGPCRHSRSGTRCILPCSSAAISGCSQAAFRPARHMSLSDSRGIITGIPAWSDPPVERVGHRQDIVLPVFLVCTIPHPLTRTSSALFTVDPAAQTRLMVTSEHSSDAWLWRRSTRRFRPRSPADLRCRTCRRATSRASPPRACARLRRGPWRGTWSSPA